MFKILQARLQQYMTPKLPDVQAGFTKGRSIRDKIVNIGWKKKKSFRKISISTLLTMSKPLTVWITTNCGKFLTWWEYQITLPASLEICMQVKKQQLESDMEQQTDSKLGKEYIKSVFSHPVYLTYKPNTSRKMPGWMKYKLKARFLGKYKKSQKCKWYHT